MPKSPQPPARKPWIAPRIDTLSTGNAKAGFVAINIEGLGKGS